MTQSHAHMSALVLVKQIKPVIGYHYLYKLKAQTKVYNTNLLSFGLELIKK